jgi:hypothetical protein
MKMIMGALCMTLSLAAAANAGVVTSYSGDVGVNATVDFSGSTYDVVTLAITSINGGSAVKGMSGVWSETGTTGFYLSKGSVTRTTSAYDSSGSTYVNVDSQTNKMWDGTTVAFATPTSTTDVCSSFGDTWFSSNTSGNLSVGDTLAVIYITKGWHAISFGNYDTSANLAYVPVSGGSFNNETITVSVPEPSTLALLAGGLAGLIAYAWRKRKSVR